MKFPDHSRYLIGNYPHPSLEITHGKGTNLWDSDGNQYLDFTSGIAVTNIGHSHPHWLEKVSEQASKLVHCSNLYSISLQVKLAERLVEKIGPGKILFCNSGAEANEALIKLSRLHASNSQKNNLHKFSIIGAENGFHGRTMGALSATNSSKYRKGFEPLLSTFTFAKLNKVETFKDLIDDQTGAVLIESIQGEGGIFEAEDSFLQSLRALCSTEKLLLLLDEVQAGFGRTGEFLGFQKSGILPDAVAMAKGLGGGFPIGAIWVEEEYEEVFTPGTHGTTFGGSPLACAAAHAVLDVIEQENLIARSKKLGKKFKDSLIKLCQDFPDHLLEIRGRGLMLGIVCSDDPSPLIKILRERGLLTVGASGNVIRLLPPLTVLEKELDDALSMIHQCLSEWNPK